MINARSITALALLLGVIVVLGGIACGGFLLASQLTDDIDAQVQRRTLLERQIALSGGTNLTDAAGGQTQTFLMPTVSAGIAGAQLQSRVIDTVQRHGGQVVSAQVRPEVGSGGLQKISVSVVVRLDLQALRDLVYDLEVAAPLVFIEELLVSTGTQTDRPEAGLAPLDVTLRASSYMQKGSGP